MICAGVSVTVATSSVLKPAQHAGNGAWHCRSGLGVGDLIDAALATQPITPQTTAPDRRKRFKVIDGDRDDEGSPAW
jgi:hypothetical protein